MRQVRSVRLSEGERSLIRVAAERQGIPESTFLRKAALERASVLLATEGYLPRFLIGEGAEEDADDE